MNDLTVQEGIKYLITIARSAIDTGNRPRYNEARSLIQNLWPARHTGKTVSTVM